MNKNFLSFKQIPKNEGEPLVSVICLCYNHEKFVKKALESVYFQTYSNIELIIVDDCSQDKSVKIIHKFLEEELLYKQSLQNNNSKVFYRKIIFLQHADNQGNCKSFNEAFKLAQGKYIIDLATDDILLDERIEKQVQLMEAIGEEYGVIFSNALEINEKGDFLHYHFPVDEAQKTKVNVPSGWIYQAILEKYFIPTCTMMMRKKVLDDLGGYDESLSYEDFDFWVRSARKYQYYYQDETTTLRRIVPNSHSSKFYQKKQNPHLGSTLKVCQKALGLNKNEAENQALAQCVQYHLRQSFFTQNFKLVFEFEKILNQIPQIKSSKSTKWILRLASWKIKVFWLYKIYLKIKTA